METDIRKGNNNMGTRNEKTSADLILAHVCHILQCVQGLKDALVKLVHTQEADNSYRVIYGHLN